MIYEELVHGEYMYIVTDREGRCIAETYSRAEAEQLLAQYQNRTLAKYELGKGVLVDPLRK